MLPRNAFLIIVCTLLIGLSSCRGKQTAPETYTASVKGKTAEVFMAEYKPAFRNPMKGWREFYDPGAKKRDIYPYPYGSMIKEYMQWNMMEDLPTDGVDKVINYSNHRWKGVEDINMKIIPRAYIVWIEPWHGGKDKDPDNPDDLNGQHWPTGIPPQTSPYKNVPGEWACYIEPADSITPIVGGYFDPAFPERVEAFVEKLGKAWDNDPRVAYVEMGIIGEWGEHHDPDLSTYWPPHDEPKHVDGRTWIKGMEKTLGDAFTKAFKNKKVMVRYAYEFKDYEFGSYWDSWAIDEEIDRGYNAILALGDRWKTQVIGGEITWGWGSLRLKNLEGLEGCLADGPTRELIIEQVRNLHCNHLGGVTWADFTNEDFLRHADEVQKALGYRYVLDRATYPVQLNNGQEWQIEFSLLNTGSSPFYYSWPLEVSLLDTQSHRKVWSSTIDADITQWMPGENWCKEQKKYLQAPQKYVISDKFKFDKVPEGEYILALAVLDPAGNLPSLRFANTNYLEGGRTALGYVGVGVPVANPEIPKEEFDDICADTTLRYILSKEEKKPKVIFDTDLGNDIDDVLALQMVINYDKAGLIDLSAVTISKCNPHSISFVDGFLRYNGYHDMPLGYAYDGVNPEDHMYLLPTLAAEYKGKKLLHPVQSIDSGIEEGHIQIRKQLAQAADSSAVLVAVGPLTNIARLLLSEPDKISPLNGIDLVRQKVRSVSIMSGNMAEETAEWNVLQDLEATKVVYEKCPVSLIVSGFEVGSKILYPHQSILNDFGNPAANPLCVAYQHYAEMPYDRQCWDLTSVYDAFDADRSIYKHSEHGTIHIDEKGISRFKPHPNGLHQYLIVDDADVERAVKELVNVVTMK